MVGHGESLRVENRLPGGDVNPYLAVAAIIASGLHGIENELELEPLLEGNAYESDKQHVPSTLREAAALFAGSKIARSRSATRWSTTTATPHGSSSMRTTPPSPTGSGSVGSNASRRLLRRPRIGITTYLEPTIWGIWNRDAALLPRVYLDAVVAAGGVPLLLPPVGTDPSVLEILDGLVIAGGCDVDPGSYGDSASGDGRHQARPRRPRSDPHPRRTRI